MTWKSHGFFLCVGSWPSVGYLPVSFNSCSDGKTKWSFILRDVNPFLGWEDGIEIHTKHYKMVSILQKRKLAVDV